MVKRTDSSNNWIIIDNKRDPENVVDIWLHADQTVADQVGSGDGAFDFLSNGFKLRTTYASRNASSGNYIYMAFAEAPFVTSTGVPTNAR